MNWRLVGAIARLAQALALLGLAVYTAHRGLTAWTVLACTGLIIQAQRDRDELRDRRRRRD
jgi:hypothetical protein